MFESVDLRKSQLSVPNQSLFLELAEACGREISLMCISCHVRFEALLS